MTDDAKQVPVVFERSYDAPLEDLWELWTTKEGFESWWGPEGFRVDVHAMEPRVGGALHYSMIAVGEEQIAYMLQSGHSVSHAVRGKFSELVPLERLKLTQMIDFVPGVEPYEHDMLVEFSRQASSSRMVVTVAPHVSEELSRMAALGFESQLTKVPAVLAARKAAG